MKVVTVIPARGGSKGIINKNLIMLANQPLLFHTITCSMKSSVDQTWVSSDSDEILKYSSSLGARTIRRPPELSTDMASSESALLHFTEHVEFDVLVFMQATSPLTLPSDIDAALKMLNQHDAILSVAENHQFRWVNGQPDYDPENRLRRQDRPVEYIENGAFYVTSRRALLKSKIRVSGNIGFFKMPKSRSFEIDDLDDLKTMEILIRSKTHLV